MKYLKFCQFSVGQGKSKKGAKRVAAERMLKFLHELPAHKQDEELAIDEDNQEVLCFKINYVFISLF